MISMVIRIYKEKGDKGVVNRTRQDGKIVVLYNICRGKAPDYSVKVGSV